MLILLISFVTVLYGAITTITDIPTIVKLIGLTIIGIFQLVPTAISVYLEVKTMLENRMGVTKYIINSIIRKICGQQYNSVAFDYGRGKLSGLFYCDPFSRVLLKGWDAKMVVVSEFNEFRDFSTEYIAKKVLFRMVGNFCRSKSLSIIKCRKNIKNPLIEFKIDSEFISSKSKRVYSVSQKEALRVPARIGKISSKLREIDCSRISELVKNYFILKRCPEFVDIVNLLMETIEKDFSTKYSVKIKIYLSKVFKFFEDIERTKGKCLGSSSFTKLLKYKPFFSYGLKVSRGLSTKFKGTKNKKVKTYKCKYNKGLKYLNFRKYHDYRKIRTSLDDLNGYKLEGMRNPLSENDDFLDKLRMDRKKQFKWCYSSFKQNLYRSYIKNSKIENSKENIDFMGYVKKIKESGLYPYKFKKDGTVIETGKNNKSRNGGKKNNRLKYLIFPDSENLKGLYFTRKFKNLKFKGNLRRGNNYMYRQDTMNFDSSLVVKYCEGSSIPIVTNLNFDLKKKIIYFLTCVDKVINAKTGDCWFLKYFGPINFPKPNEGDDRLNIKVNGCLNLNIYDVLKESPLKMKVIRRIFMSLLKSKGGERMLPIVKTKRLGNVKLTDSKDLVLKVDETFIFKTIITNHILNVETSEMLRLKSILIRFKFKDNEISELLNLGLSKKGGEGGDVRKSQPILKFFNKISVDNHNFFREYNIKARNGSLKVQIWGTKIFTANISFRIGQSEISPITISPMNWVTKEYLIEFLNKTQEVFMQNNSENSFICIKPEEIKKTFYIHCLSIDEIINVIKNIKNYQFYTKNTTGVYYSGGEIFKFNLETEYNLKELSKRLWGSNGNFYLNYVLGKVTAVKKPDSVQNKLWKHYLYDINSIITQGEGLSKNFLKKFDNVGNSKTLIKMIGEGFKFKDNFAEKVIKISDSLDAVIIKKDNGDIDGVNEEIKEIISQIESTNLKIAEDEKNLREIKKPILLENAYLNTCKGEIDEFNNTMKGSDLGLSKDNYFYNSTYSSALRRFEHIENDIRSKELKLEKDSLDKKPESYLKREQGKILNHYKQKEKMESSLKELSDASNIIQKDNLKKIEENRIKNEKLQEFKLVVDKKKEKYKAELVRLAELKQLSEAKISKKREELHNSRKLKGKSGSQNKDEGGGGSGMEAKIGFKLHNRFDCLSDMKDEEIYVLFNNSVALLDSNASGGNKVTVNKNKNKNKGKGKTKNKDKIKDKIESEDAPKKGKVPKASLSPLYEIFRLNKAKKKEVTEIIKNYSINKQVILDIEEIIAEAIAIKNDLAKRKGTVGENELITYPVFNKNLKERMNKNSKTNRCYKRLTLFLFDLIGVELTKFTYKLFETQDDSGSSRGSQKQKQKTVFRSYKDYEASIKKTIKNVKKLKEDLILETVSGDDLSGPKAFYKKFKFNYNCSKLKNNKNDDGFKGNRSEVKSADKEYPPPENSLKDDHGLFIMEDKDATDFYYNFMYEDF